MAITVKQPSPIRDVSDRNVRSVMDSHLNYLDGLRGLSSIYVVLFHIHLYSVSSTSWLFYATQWTAYGRTAVAVFIVLSGYCLMIPVARSAGGQLKGGIGQYFVRRARRILPPYYFSLAIGIILGLTVPAHWIIQDPVWRTMPPSLTVDNILAHLFVVHNSNASWVYKINGALWSIATEWQIYFVFGLVLLPVWRQFGIKAVLPLSFILGLLPLRLFGKLEWAAPWFIGLFTLGMAAAAVNFSPRTRMAFWREKMAWGWLSFFLFTLYVLILFTGKFSPPGNWKLQFVQDVWVGLACACLLVSCTNELTNPSAVRSPILALLQSRWAVAAGAFSYSLYLVHEYVLVLLHTLLPRIARSDYIQFIVFAVLALPLSLLVAYGFHLVFEKPFMKYAQKRELSMPHSTIPVSPEPETA